jgi:menaquinone-dependent protoporphyrinogen oxidase
MVNRRILVAYATYKGSTVAIAQAVADVLRADGTRVDVRPAAEVEDLSDYEAVVVGSAIYNGKWLPDAVEFAQGHHRALSRIPVALFTVCLTMIDDSEKARLTTLGYLDPVLEALPHVKPQDVGLFAGVYTPAKWSWVVRTLLKYVNHIPAGDFRDWNAVRQWAEYIREMVFENGERKAA